MKNHKKLHLAALASAAVILFLILVSSMSSAATSQGPVKTYTYILNSGDNNVSVIDTTNNTVTSSVKVGDFPIVIGQFIGKGPAQ